MKDHQLATSLRPVLSEHQLELEDVQVTPVGKRLLVRITVDGDGPHGRGPLLDDITVASQAISQVLDELDFGGSRPYTLEVSSRGVSKPLTEPKHYRRNVDRLVKVHHGPDKAEVTGRIVEAGASAVTLDVEGDELVIGYGDIAKAVVQVELNRPALGLDEAEDFGEEEN